jgi:uncharacterized protein (TIGR03435 family)
VTIPIALAVWLALAQTGQSVVEPPVFETASVTPNTSREAGFYFNYIRGRFHATHVTLRVLIRSAYGVQDGEIVGGPEWMNADPFNVEAKGDVGNSPAPTVAHTGDPSRLQLMMQALLADRFKLVVHWERQETDVYALTLLSDDGRLGPGLKHTDVDCVALATEARRSGSRARTQTSRCDLSRDAGSLAIGGRPVAQLANSLSNIVGRTVIDQTGLRGNFDVRLTWTAEHSPPSPSLLLVAIREQLGLALTAQKRPAEVLVVDRAERPVEH